IVGPVVDNLPATAAIATSGRSLHPSQNSIGYFGHLPSAVTGRAHLIGYTLGLYLALYFDLFLYPKCHFFQIQFYANAQIAALDPGLTTAKTSKTTKTTSKSAAKNIPELAKDIVHIHTTTTKTAAFKGCMAILIV